MAKSAIIKQAADMLWEAVRSGVACPPVRTLLGDADADDAYKVQELNTARMIASGRRLVGRKIGLTSRAVQQQLGVLQPDYGMLFDDMAIAAGRDIPWMRVLQPKVEAEIALVLRDDLDSESLISCDVLSAVDYALPAIEVVGSRIENWDIGIVDTIADNASSGVFILGDEPRKLDSFDIRLCGMVMERRGEPVSEGAGIACLGSPISSALWLAKTMARVGHPLRRGDVVLTGALGPMVSVGPGDVVTARINQLGTVTACFGN